MNAEPSRPGGRVVQPTKRKHSIKQIVFSYAHNETETSGRETRNPMPSQGRQKKGTKSDKTFLNRYGGMDHVVKDEHRDRICFIHNHKIVRAAKVYINIYHLWKRWLNRALRSLGLGGGYHTAIEISAKEFHFGGSLNADSGIFESKPLHRIKSKEEPIDSSTMSQEDWTGLELALQMGPLKERHVVGLWSGTEADFDLLLRHLKEKEHWNGLNYRLLTFNCNHFAKSVCDLLLKHSKYFHPAKGMTSSENMVPSYLFRLTRLVQSRCLTNVVGNLDQDELLLSNETRHTFCGRARYSSRSCSPPQRPVTDTCEISRSHGTLTERDKDRRQSLPELRNLRIRALDQKTKYPKKEPPRGQHWRHNITSFSLLHTDRTERTTTSAPPEDRSFFGTEELDAHFADKPISTQSQRHATAPRADRVAVSTSSTDQILLLRKLNPDNAPPDVQVLKARPRPRSCSESTKQGYVSERSRPPRQRDSISEEPSLQPHLTGWNTPTMLSSGSFGGMTDVVTSMEDQRCGIDCSTQSIQSVFTKNHQS